MSDKLRRCPWCNEENLVHTYAARQHWIRCTNDDCDAVGPSGDSEEKAIASWNTRADDALIRRLGEALMKLQKYFHDETSTVGEIVNNALADLEDWEKENGIN